MSFSSLPLGYCTNVHPCRSAVDVPPMLDRHTLPVRKRCGFEIAAGLWLPEAAVREATASAATLHDLAGALADRGLTCHTLNAFPFGDFHGDRVKETVYLPDWTEPRRLDYTLACATLLAALLPEDVAGSISTLPLGFKQHVSSPTFIDEAGDRLLACARGLEELHQQTGRLVRLAIEPEPLCVLETTDETLRFFTRLFERAAERGIEECARRHLGVCYDVCHQAVEFEDAAAAIAAYPAAGVRINKVQISCAVEVADPLDPDQRAALAAYVEPRYLHQTFGRAADGSISSVADLSTEFVREPPVEWLSCRPWRVHYHVPVDAERIGPLGTTRGDLKQALHAIGRLDYAPHLEVETYTWPVLPGADPVDLVEGLARELLATRALIEQVNFANL